MATVYKLTWRREGRWRKKYKGRTYYFAAPEGKVASYSRCFAEWLLKKAEIDQQGLHDDPSRRAFRSLMFRVKGILASIQAKGDTPENRRAWLHWEGVLNSYEYLIQQGMPFPFHDESEEANPDTVPLTVFGGGILDTPEEAPPWEQRQIELDPSLTLEGNVERFLRKKRRQVEAGQLSHGRYDSLRVTLESFSHHIRGSTPLASINGQHLRGFLDKLETHIDRGELTSHTARDRIQAVKQFVNWAWSEELMELPRILKSSEFGIRLPETTIDVFTEEEVRRLIGAASDSTKLYLLLMLNCGMQQQDLAELGQDEVDWKLGTITRKRSKTRKRNGDSVPTVVYKLWPETFAMLTAHRSKHPKLALTNAKGGPLKLETIVNGHVKKIDNVRSAYARVVRKLADSKTDPIKIDKPLKLLRKTAATKLGEHPEFGRFAQHFLGHAPATVADRHYIVPAQEQFDRALAWLRTQLLV